MKLALIESLVVASGGILSFGSILIILLMLSARGGLLKAIAYFTGYSSGYFLIGACALFLGQRLGGEAAGAAAEPSLVGPILSLVLGILLLISGLRRWRRPPQPDDKPPRIFSGLDSITVWKALGLGLMISVINVKNLAIFLSAVGILAGAGLSLPRALAAEAVVVLLFSSSVLGPIVVYALFRERADPGLTSLRAFLERRSRPLSIGAMLLFGAAFTARGVYLLM